MSKRPETERDRLMREARAATGVDYKGVEWFREVFMYHYFRYIVIGIVLAVIAGFVVYDFVGRTEPDFVLTMGVDAYVAEGAEQELVELVEQEVGDLNGDGEVYVLIRVMPVAVDNPTDSVATMQMNEAFDVTFFAEESYVLYVMHDSVYERFTGNLEPLDKYGVVGERHDAVYASDAPVLARMGIMPDCWLVMRGRRGDRASDAAYAAMYDASARVIERILNTP